jgi:hypothetical protein
MLTFLIVDSDLISSNTVPISSMSTFNVSNKFQLSNIQKLKLSKVKSSKKGLLLRKFTYKESY